MSYAPFTPYSLVERGITEDNYEAMIMAMQGGQLMDVAEFADFLQNKNAKSCIKKFRFLGKAALIDDGETYDEFANNNLKIMANSYSPWVNMEQPSIGSKMTDCYWEFHQMVWRPDPVYPWQSDYMRS